MASISTARGYHPAMPPESDPPELTPEEHEILAEAPADTPVRFDDEVQAPVQEEGSSSS